MHRNGDEENETVFILLFQENKHFHNIKSHKRRLSLMTKTILSSNTVTLLKTTSNLNNKSTVNLRKDDRYHFNYLINISKS